MGDHGSLFFQQMIEGQHWKAPTRKLNIDTSGSESRALLCSSSVFKHISWIINSVHLHWFLQKMLFLTASYLSNCQKSKLTQQRQVRAGAVISSSECCEELMLHTHHAYVDNTDITNHHSTNTGIVDDEG